MSKLSYVRRALEASEEFVVAGVREQEFTPDRTGFFAHVVDVHIAPKHGIYDAKVLQGMLENELVPGLTWSKKDDFHETDQEFKVGLLEFHEEIGLRIMRETIRLVDRSLISCQGFNNTDVRESERFEHLYRCVSVRLYPNLAFARDAFSNHRVHYIIYKDQHPDFFRSA